MKFHMWPYEGTPHPVGKKHKDKNGNKHWSKGPVQFNIIKNRYKEGI